MHFVEVIQAKRDGKELTEAQLRYAIEAYTADRIPDYQMSALIMAIFLRGMNAGELAVWTDAMLHSGKVLDWSSLGKATVDKHSTGGVGDKISIPLAPAVAACGLAVPMISGRGLGHTGGTLDKLEAIPGFQVRITEALAKKALETCGVAMMGQTESIAPADKRLYALRDATGTVESIPLISSSIMSKKLAEGIGGLVLDVKVGSGAFMKTQGQATELAKTLVGIGLHSNCETVALLTRMDRPLGIAVGNALEIEESIDVMKGQGPDDVRRLVVELGAEMLVLGGASPQVSLARKDMERVLDNGEALGVFRDMIEIQGGNPRVVDSPKSILPQAKKVIPVHATQSGWLSSMDTTMVGMASLVLGAGREKKTDVIDPAVGIRVLHRVGSPLEKGEVVAELHVNGEERLEEATARLHRALEYGDEKPEETPLFIDRISRDDLGQELK